LITQHSNLNFASGKPKGLGDILMEQDRLRDFAWLWDRVGALFLDIVGGSAELVSGGVVTQGGTFSEINVTTAILYAPFSVTLGIDGNNPPGTGTEDITSIRISLPAQTNFSIAGATLDGVTVNYVKVKYSETENLTRSKLKATGTWAFTQLPSEVLTCDAVAPTSYEVAIATLVGDGTSVLTITQKYPLFQNLISSSGAYLALSSGSPYTLSAWQASQVDVTTGASDFVLNLPSSQIGMKIKVRKVDVGAGKVQITPNGSDAINGVTGSAAWEITDQWGYVDIEAITGGWSVVASDGTNYTFPYSASLQSRTIGTWYNLTSFTLGAGVYEIGFQGQLACYNGGTAGQQMQVQSCLSLTSAAAGDNSLTAVITTGATVSGGSAIGATVRVRKKVYLSGSTTYYLNILGQLYASQTGFSNPMFMFAKRVG